MDYEEDELEAGGKDGCYEKEADQSREEEMQLAIEES